MASLSDSFTKLVLKIGENVTRKNDNVRSPGTPHTPHGPPPKRPGSPFIMLDGDEEFQYNVDTNGVKSDESFDSILDHIDSPLLNESSDFVGFEEERDNDFSESRLFEICKSEDEVESSSDDEAAMLENDEMRSHRGDPLLREQFQSYFDECGRLVNEHDLRKQIFKGGVDKSIRKDVWSYLFELFPFNSTHREREILQVENKVRYEAMKLRWKNILKNLMIDHDYEGVRYCPKWYSGCPKKQVKSKNPGDAASNANEINKSLQCSERTTNNTSVIPVDVENDVEGEEEKVDVNETQVDSITMALEDAMLDYDESHKTFERNTSILSDVSLVDRIVESPDFLYAPRHFSQDYQEAEEIPAEERFDNKVFPNPFELSPEYVNTQESLFSLSENIDSIDIELLGGKHNSKILETADECQNRFFENLNADDSGNVSLVNKLNDSTMLNSNEHKEMPTPETNNLGIPISTHEHSELSDENNKESSELSEKKIGHFESSHDMNELAELSQSANRHSQLSDELNDHAELFDKELSQVETIDNQQLQSLEEDNTDLEKCYKNSTNPVFEIEVEHDDDKKSDIDRHIHLDGRRDFSGDVVADGDDNRYLVPTNIPTNPLNIKNNTVSMNGFDKFDCDHEIKRPNAVYEKPVAARSPTGESLERLPPWIAQMIKASTPNQTRNNENEMKPVNIELEECYCRQVSEELQLHKERMELNKELLGIVENANKYVEQNMKLHSGSNTPKQQSRRTTPTNFTPIKPDNIPKQNETSVKPVDDGLFLSPISSIEADVFLHHTPSLKLVTDLDEYSSNDNVIDNENNQTFKLCPYCSFEPETQTRLVLSVSLGEDLVKFMEIQAQVFAARQPYNEKDIAESIRVIDKDVPRTDRELDMFSGNSNPGLLKLRDALLTYAFFHPEVGYAQGMNDIMARFLYVMNDEAEAYWMFLRYMEHFKNDFMEKGMLKKISQVEQLLMRMDRELYDFLQSTDMGLIFCHRWLLLNFKREFEYNEAVRLFEITSSRHLEVSSLSAEIERSKERAKEFVKDKAGSHMEEVFLLPEYPFDVFLCVAMLMECREMIMGTLDITMVYQILSNLPKTLDLQKILRRSEELFYRYCRKTTVDCFQVIDDLEVPDQKRSRLSFPFSFR